jgi:prevent-host-death family protein
MPNKRVVTATEFKAGCLGILTEMEKSGETITITRRGKPVAVLAPAPKKGWKSPINSWAGRGRIVGDIVYGDPDIWTVNQDDGGV